MAGVSALAGAPAIAAPGDAARVNPNVPLAGGWTARFYVSPVTTPFALRDETIVQRTDALGINAQLSRRLTQNTRMSIELLNAFDRESTATAGLVPPTAGRGIQLGLRATFK